ncbi:MAG: ABC transporter permease [Planctomycetota bacterium]
MKSYLPFLSLRYLWFHKLSSALGILGVTLGVGLIIVVVGVMDGFQARLRSSLLGTTAAVVVKPHYDVDADELVTLLKRDIPGVLDASPVVRTTTLIGTERRGARQGLPCQVLGIDAAREIEVGGLRQKLRYGEGPRAETTLLDPATPDKPFLAPDRIRYPDQRIRPEKNGVILGIRLATRLGARTGDRISLFTLEDKDPDASGREVSVVKELFFITGLYNSKDSEIDSMLVLMDRRDALSFFQGAMRREADEVRLLLEDPEAVDSVKAAIVDRHESIVKATNRTDRVSERALVVQTWKDIHYRLLAAVENERSLLLVITSFSFIVVAFLIGSTQSMLVVEKTREIGVLRSLGASVMGTSGVFLANGLFIGTIGAACGYVLGMGVATNVADIADWIRTTFGRDLFPADIYRFDEIPIQVHPEFVMYLCTGAVVFALLGAILPALRAAGMDPVASLHHE